MNVTRTWTKTDKKGREETWEWDVSPETLTALANFYELVAKNRANLS